MQHVIITEELTRIFRGRPAVHSVSFRVPRGAVFALIGRNGAGKTTLLRMLLGLLAPTRGRATILGHDSSALPIHARGRIGYVPEGHPLYAWMRASDCERMQKQHFSRWSGPLFRTIVDAFRIAPRAHVRELSRGQRAGLCLALSLATQPDVLVLDDPSLGLDPVAQRAFIEALFSYTRQQERTVLIATHALSDVERVADWVAVLDQGVLRACAPLEVLRKRVKRYTLCFKATPPPVPALSGLLTSALVDHELRVTVANSSEQTRVTLQALEPATLEEADLGVEDALLAYLDKGGSANLLFTQEGAGL